MADKEMIKQLQERVDFLEKLVTSLVTKIEPTTNPAATEARASTAESVQSTSDTANEAPGSEVSYLMKLPTELRMDIYEYVLAPIFPGYSTGLIPPLSLPVTFYASRSRFPAILHVDSIMRAESLGLYLDMARSRIAELEYGNKCFYDEIEAVQEEHKHLVPWYGRPYEDAFTRGLGKAIVDSFQAMTDIDLACKALEGTFKHERGSAARCCACEK